jgi:flagellar hook-associated protein 2
MASINFSGIASGIDTSSLIKSILDQQRSSRIKPLEDKRSAFQDANSSFTELKSLLDKLSDSAQTFRSISGGAVAKQGTSSDETVASVSASNAAASGTYNISVTQRAKNGTYSYNDRFSSETSVLNSSINNGAAPVDRTVNIEVGSGASAETVAIELTNTSTARDFVTSFNSQSSLATASIVNVGTSSVPSYAIVINSNSEGLDLGTISQTASGSELASGSGALQASTVSQATNATLSLSGVSGTITRSSNTVSDVISGVTLSLQSIGSTQVSVSADAGKTTSSLQSLVDAYNAVVTYISENDRISQEEGDGGQTKNIFGPLTSSSLDENVLGSLRNALSNAGISNSTINLLADLGVTTQRNGTLAFDSSVFEDALSSNESSVGTILTNLSDDIGGVAGTIAEYTRFNGAIDRVISVNSEGISSLNKRITEVESSLSSQEKSLTQQYARLEGLIGKLNSQQSTLTAVLPR